MKACRPLRNNAKSLGEAVARHLNFSDGLVLKKKHLFVERSIYSFRQLISAQSSVLRLQANRFVYFLHDLLIVPYLFGWIKVLLGR